MQSNLEKLENINDLTQSLFALYKETFSLYQNFRSKFRLPDELYIVNDYLDKSFIKMNNLALSLTVLTNHGFADEGLIITRTMLEHLTNFIYIFKQNSEGSNILEEKIKLFFNYNGKKHWSGKNSFRDFFEMSMNDCSLDEQSIKGFYNIYKELCLYSHPKQLNYEELNNGLFQTENCIKVVAYYHILYTSFLEVFFKINKKIENNLHKYKQVEQSINSLCKQAGVD